MDVKIFPVAAFEQNCSLVVCPATRKAALVDPGGDIDALEAIVAQSDVVLEKILITHGHVDHCGQAGVLAKRLGVPIEGPHHDDEFWIAQLDSRGATFGMTGTQPFVPDRWLHDGDVVMVGDQRLDVVHCPGHTPGHVVFVHAQDRLAFVGDVLFTLGCGRLFEGTPAQMWNSLQALAAWPDETIIWCAHEYTAANARFALSVDDRPEMAARAEMGWQLQPAARSK